MPSEKGETKQEAKQEKNLPKSKKSAVRKGKKTEDEKGNTVWEIEVEKYVPKKIFISNSE